MRSCIWGLLLAAAAHCLLAGVIGFGASVYCVASPYAEDAEASRVGLIVSAVLFILGGASLIGAVAASRQSDRPQVWRPFFWWVVVAFVMVIPTGLIFGPSGGFHHHFGFGFPFFYMVWNGEDPQPGSFQIISGYEVWFRPVRFGMLLAIWMVLFAAVVWTIRPWQKNWSEAV